MKSTLADEYRSGDREIRRLLDDTELWFILVANPDGYQYTFVTPGETTVGDGVDPNLNLPDHFVWDEEGSSSIFSSGDLPRPRGHLGGRDAGHEGPGIAGSSRFPDSA